MQGLHRFVYWLTHQGRTGRYEGLMSVMMVVAVMLGL